jgi:hypothetical protein
MGRIIFPLLASMALTACATGPSLQSQMAAYIGASSQTLVQSLGVPDKQITANGITYLAYQLRHSAQVQPVDFPFGGFGSPFAGPFYGGGYYGGFNPGLPMPVQEFSCVSTFMLKDDKVFNFVLRGNDCG